MKITIPMNEQKLESGVCPSFGRAPYFLLYDTNTNESKWIANSAAESSGGAGIAAAERSSAAAGASVPGSRGVGSVR